MSELATYPIKGCGGVALETAKIAETGFELDREFMLIDETGKFITQRTHPLLAAARLSLASDHLLVHIPGFGEQEIGTEYDPDMPVVYTSVHGKDVTGLDQGHKAAEIFSRFLGQEVRLLRASHENARHLSEHYRRFSAVNRVGFADGFPFLLTSRASLHEQHRLMAMRYGSVPMNRFRPNVVIDGFDLEPYAEDKWKHVQIGALSAFIVRACDRCQVTSVIQSGNDAGQVGFLKVRADFLKSRAGIDQVAPNTPRGRFFGQNLNHDKHSVGKVVKIGDPVYVDEEGDSNIRLKST